MILVLACLSSCSSGHGLEPCSKSIWPRNGQTRIELPLWIWMPHPWILLGMCRNCRLLSVLGIPVAMRIFGLKRKSMIGLSTLNEQCREHFPRRLIKLMTLISTALMMGTSFLLIIKWESKINDIRRFRIRNYWIKIILNFYLRL